MKLYLIKYKEWNMFFSNLYDRQMLSVGKSEREAIRRVKSRVCKDARDFEAEEIAEVFGHKIIVQ